VEIARRVARAVRHSSGGLRHVKALGLLVEGQAQVSMNVTDFAVTPVARVLEMVRREAARWGAAVARSEVIGLVPQQALLDAAQWYLQLALEPDQILEDRLGAEEGPLTVFTPFVDAVAAETPAPGGGSVAALAGALAAALAAMVARLTKGRRRYAAVEPEMQEIEAEAEDLRRGLARRVAEDADAYDQVVAAYRLPKGTAEQKADRQGAIQAALVHAAEVPLSTARDAAKALDLARRVAMLGNPNALTDAGTAAHMALAAFEGAALNVRINAGQVTDPERTRNWIAELEQLRARCRRAMEETQSAIEERWPT
jgi:glutamate formiminotransferase/formiminotetrahydrofolate cyclodeaminase